MCGQADAALWPLAMQVALAAAGISPGSKRYRRVDVEAAVRGAYNITPLLSCTKGTVVELWMCLGLDLEPFDCPSAVQALDCPAMVLLPRGGTVPFPCSRFFPAMAKGGAGSSAPAAGLLSDAGSKGAAGAEGGAGSGAAAAGAGAAAAAATSAAGVQGTAASADAAAIAASWAAGSGAGSGSGSSTVGHGRRSGSAEQA